MMKLILFFILIQFVNAFPNGAPNSTCTSMMPQHDISSRECQLKYIIQSEKSEYSPEDTIRITVRALAKDDFFKGVLLTAKNSDNQQFLGTWSTDNALVKTISCDGRDNRAVTHSSPNDKSEITAFWHAPSDLSNRNILIKATIVKSYEEIYVDCFSLTITSKQNHLSNELSMKINSEKDRLIKANTNITWKYEDSTVTMTMTSTQVNLNEWRAIGFSDDRQMGDEYVFICQVSSDGETSLRRMHTKLGKRTPSISNEEVNIINTAYENGQMTCQFSFEIVTEQSDGEPVPITIDEDYYLTFAAGILKNEEDIAKHNLTFITSKTYQLKNFETINLNELMSTTTVVTGPSTISSTNSSIIVSTSTPNTNDVNVNISWTYVDSLTHVKMIINHLRLSQWLAIGFSLDESMGEDHVFICQHLADDTVSLQRFINPIGHSRPILASTISNPGGMFNITRQKVENDIVYCEFTLSNFVDIKRRPRQTDFPELSLTTVYRPLIAIGNMDSSNNLIRHSQTSRTSLSQTVLLNRQETILYNIQTTNSNATNLMKAHGIIMTFTWIVFVSTGILVARYFKRSWTDQKICGKAIWFAIHRTIMSSVAILTLISFILILVYKKGQWISENNRREFAHSIIGILIICFAIIQPFMALFRCNPDDHYRFIFNYAHATIGFTAFILSIVAIFLAMFFTQFHFQLNKDWVILVVWSCWLPIVFIIFEFIEIYFRKSQLIIDKRNSYIMNDRNRDGTTKIEAISMENNVYKDRMKKLFLLLHIIIAFGLALALIIRISQS